MTRPGTGIPWLWQLPDDHWTTPAALWHDEQYDLRAAGYLLDPTSKYVDIEFYRRLNELAEGRRYRRLQAAVFYGLARIWGSFRWPKPS